VPRTFQLVQIEIWSFELIAFKTKSFELMKKGLWAQMALGFTSYTFDKANWSNFVKTFNKTWH